MVKSLHRSDDGAAPSRSAVPKGLKWQKQVITSTPIASSDGPATHMLALLCVSSVPWLCSSSLARRTGCTGKTSSSQRACRLHSWWAQEKRIQVPVPRNGCSSSKLKEPRRGGGWAGTSLSHSTSPRDTQAWHVWRRNSPSQKRLVRAGASWKKKKKARQISIFLLEHLPCADLWLGTSQCES